MRENIEFGKPDPFTLRLAQCLRDLRHQSGWSLDDLMDRSGVSRATLSRLEHAEVSPTALALSRIAGAYGMSSSRLLRIVEGDAPQLTQLGEQPVATDAESGVETRLVSSATPLYKGAVVELVVPTGAADVALPGEKPGAEYTLVLQAGRVTVTCGQNGFAMRKGDCLRFFGDGATRLTVDGQRDARILVVAI